MQKADCFRVTGHISPTDINERMDECVFFKVQSLKNDYKPEY